MSYELFEVTGLLEVFGYFICVFELSFFTSLHVHM